jgi:hypothetical protein
VIDREAHTGLRGVRELLPNKPMQRTAHALQEATCMDVAQPPGVEVAPTSGPEWNTTMEDCHGKASEEHNLPLV